MQKTYEQIMERRPASIDPAVAALRPAFERADDSTIALLDQAEAEAPVRSIGDDSSAHPS